MNSDTWFPERLVSDSWLSSRFSILLNWEDKQTHMQIHKHPWVCGQWKWILTPRCSKCHCKYADNSTFLQQQTSLEVSHCLRDSENHKHREPLSLQRKHINISNQTRVVRLYQQDLQSLVCTFVCGMSHTAQAPMIGQRKMHDWLYSQVGCTQNNPQISVEPLRISTTSCSSHSHSVTKGATCELGAFLPPLLPPSSSLAFPYLKEHPRHRDEIAQFWHFSTKSSMGAKINQSETAELPCRPATLSVRRRDKQRGQFVLLHCACMSKNLLQASRD